MGKYRDFRVHPLSPAPGAGIFAVDPSPPLDGVVSVELYRACHRCELDPERQP